MKKHNLFFVVFLLFLGGKTFALTQVYNVTTLVDCPNNCGTAGYYSNCAAGYFPGFTWNDGLPAGASISVVNIQFRVGVECAPGAHAWSLNGVNQGNYTTTGNGCSCSLGGTPVSSVNASPANYSIGGANTFRMATGGSCLGYYDHWGGGIVAVVTITYTVGPPCTWSGPSGSSYPTIPCGSFSSPLSVGSGTYTYFTAIAGENYTVSTCGSSFDTDLSIYDANPAWTARAWNDNNGPDCSGTAASVTWTASYSGDHIAIVNRASCQQHDFTGTSAVLKFRRNSGCACTPNQPSTTWTGVVSSDWFNGNNWTNCVPGVNTNTTIPVVGTSYPVINGSPAYVNTITVNPGATVTNNTTLTATQ